MKKIAPALLLVGCFVGGYAAFRGGGVITETIAQPAAEVALDAAPAVPVVAELAPAPSADVSTHPTADDPDGVLLAAYKAIVNHDWWALVAVFLVGLVWLSRQPWALGRVPWFLTDRGGAVLALGISLAGVLSHAIFATGGPPSLAALWAAAKITGLGVGLYTLLKKLISSAGKPAPATP